MRVKIGNRGQVKIPTQVRKKAQIQDGDRVTVKVEGHGITRLSRERAAPCRKPTIIPRKNQHPVGDIGRPITRKEIKKALAEFP
jgi:AbrB family looped-hinge helix DNA binding protein